VFAGEVMLALALVVLEHGLFARLDLAHELLDYAPGTAEHIGGNELWLAAIQLLGIPAALLLADAHRRAFGSTLLAAAARRARPVAAIAAVIATLGAIAATLYLHGAVFTDDERTLVAQAKLLLAGGFTGPAPLPREAFVHHFMVAVGADDWAGVFPPGQPLLLAIGLRLGTAHLTQWLACGATVWIAARFAARQWNDETSVIVAGLLATSPALVLTAATLHNVVPTACCTALAIYGASAFARTGRARWGVLVGAASGLALTCRPLDGAILAVIAAGWIATSTHAWRPKLWGLALAAAVGLPCVAFQLASYRAISGSIFETPYGVWIARDWPGAHLFGFGRTVWNYQHTVGTALAKTFAAWLRLDGWALGWPISLAGLALWLAGSGRDRATTWLVALIALHAFGYFFYAFGAVHDFGSYYHLVPLPALVVVTARALVASSRRDWLLRIAGAASVVGLATFWPIELAHLDAIASRTEAPLVAARESAGDGPILVFHTSMHPHPPMLSSWVFFAPLPSPALDEPVLWLRTRDPAVMRRALAQYPDRRPFVLRWIDGEPTLIPIRRGG